MTEDSIDGVAEEVAEAPVDQDAALAEPALDGVQDLSDDQLDISGGGSFVVAIPEMINAAGTTFPGLGL